MPVTPKEVLDQVKNREAFNIKMVEDYIDHKLRDKFVGQELILTVLLPLSDDALDTILDHYVEAGWTVNYRREIREHGNRTLFFVSLG